MVTTNITDKGARDLANLKKLEWLHFGGHISSVGLAVIGSLPKLRGLSLSSGRTIEGALSVLGGLQELDALDLDAQAISDDDLCYLDTFPALRHLRLWGGFQGPAAAYLGQAPHLLTLWLRMDTPITQDAIETLAGLQELKVLRISGKIDDQACSTLSHLSRLEELELLYPARIGDEGAEHLSRITSLKKLALGDAGLTDRGFESLARLNHLESLSVRVPELTEQGLHHLASMVNLEQLSLGIKTLADGDPSLADALRPLKQLEKLSLGMPVGGQSIAALAGMSGLERLTVSLWAEATNAVFADRGKLTALRYLYIDCGGSLSTGGLRDLNGLPSLEYLGLNNLRRDPNAIDISGLASLMSLHIHMREAQKGAGQVRDRLTNEDLACLAGLTKLEQLGLVGPGVGDEGVAHLTKLKNLRFSSVVDSSMSDEGLSDLSQLDALEDLRISGGDFTDNGLACFQKLRRLTLLELTSKQAISNKSVAGLQDNLPLLTHVTIDSARLQMR
jgi:hypothetical protein